MSKLRRLLLVALGTALAVTPAAFASHAWGNYHWSSNGTVELTLGDNVSGVWDTHFRNAEADWDQSGVLVLSVGAGGTRPKSCRPTSGRVEVCNAFYGGTGWLGVAQIWLSGGHISQGTAKMNDSYVMNEPEKRHVMCQEVGHTFGLGHTSEDGSSQNTCMDYYQNQNNNDWTSTSPNAHDYSMLSSIYGHSDPGGLKASPFLAPPAMGMIDFAGRDQWGEEIERTEDGRGSVFLLDFGHGHEVLTHVYWATPEHQLIDGPEASPWLRSAD